MPLRYPDGLPGEGVGRSACEIFLATTPAAATEGARPVASGPDLRAELMKDGEAVGVAGQLPSWVASARAKALLKSRFNEKVGGKEMKQKWISRRRKRSSSWWQRRSWL